MLFQGINFCFLPFRRKDLDYVEMHRGFIFGSALSLDYLIKRMKGLCSRFRGSTKMGSTKKGRPLFFVRHISAAAAACL